MVNRNKMDALFRRLCSVKLLHQAWKIVKLKNSAGGVDGLTVTEFEDGLGKYLGDLQKELKKRAWNPEPYLRIEIKKKKNDAERRKLGLLSVKDKIVQQAIKLLIEPRFENLFLNNSYGYRPEKGHTRAIRRTLSEFRNRKYDWVLQLDIDNYFDTINHDLLFSRLKSVVPDEEVLRLTELCVKMGVVTRRHKWEDAKQGVPQGAVLSPAFIESSFWEAQARMEEENRCRLAAKIIYGKLKNQLNLIKYFHKYHKGAVGILTERYEEAVCVLKELSDRAKKYERTENYREEIMALEAEGAVAYWGYVRALIADDGIVFETRERKGAKDLMNSLLNYGYAIMYTRVWQAILLAKLNPTESVIHVRQTNKPTFAYDVIELFRAQAVDRVVIALIQKKEPLVLENGILSEETRALLVRNILERINRYEKYRGEELKFADIIVRQVKEIAGYIVENKVYKPYIAKW